MLPTQARVFISVIVASGLGLLLFALQTLHPADFGLFGLLLFLAVLGSGLKLPVPGQDANISLGFVVLLAGCAMVSLPEVILLAAVSGLSQATIFAKTRRVAKAAFNCGALVLSVATAFLVSGLVAGAENKLGQVAVAGATQYLISTALVTLIIGLAEKKPLREIWQACGQLYLPYFAAGLACVLVATTGASPDERKLLRQPGLIVLPLMLLARQYFKGWSQREQRQKAS